MNYSLIHPQSFSLQARNVSPSKFQALSSFKSCSQFHQKRFGSTGFIKGIYHVPSEREEEEELKHSSSSSYYQRKRRKITSKIEVGKEILLDPKSFRKKIRK